MAEKRGTYHYISILINATSKSRIVQELISSTLKERFTLKEIRTTMEYYKSCLALPNSFYISNMILSEKSYKSATGRILYRKT